MNRYVGYVKPMDEMSAIPEKRKRCSYIELEQQKKHIEEYVRENNSTLARLYEDAENDDFSCNAEFAKMCDDAIHRRFDTLIVDSIYAFGQTIFEAVDILMRVFHPAGVKFIVIEDAFISEKKTQQEVEEYCDTARKRYRSRQALLTRYIPERERVVKKDYVRREEIPECIVKLIPPEKRFKRKLRGIYLMGDGKECYNDPSIQAQLQEFIRAEKDRAAYAKSKLKEAVPYKKTIFAEYMEQLDVLWNQMVEYNQEFVKLHYFLLEGYINQTEYERAYNGYMSECEKIEIEYQKYRKILFELDTLIDGTNRWIRRFTETHVPEHLDADNAMRWIRAFEIIDGTVTNIEFKYWEWREALPDICKQITEE